MKSEGKNIDFLWKEIDEYGSFLREKFIWSAGEYTVIFKIRTVNSSSYFKEEFIFRLTQPDIDSLKLNFTITDIIRENVESELEDNGKPLKDLNWKWLIKDIFKK